MKNEEREAEFVAEALKQLAKIREDIGQKDWYWALSRTRLNLQTALQGLSSMEVTMKPEADDATATESKETGWEGVEASSKGDDPK